MQKTGKSNIVAQSPLQFSKELLFHREETDRIRTMELFFGMFAHELRTQVAGMVQACRYIQEGKNQDFYVQAMSVTSLSTLHILDNMLTTVKIHAGKLHIQPVEETFCFSTWIKPLVQSVEAAMIVQRKDICLTIHPALEIVSINTDKVKLSQILYNLLNNALKFSYASTRIAVECYPFEKGLIIQVTNLGMSIPPDEINTLFKPYHQLDSGLAGIGLGLYLSQLYAETLGGTITVQSEEKAATIFTVNIPACIHPTAVNHH